MEYDNCVKCVNKEIINEPIVVNLYTEEVINYPMFDFISEMSRENKIDIIFIFEDYLLAAKPLKNIMSNIFKDSEQYFKICLSYNSSFDLDSYMNIYYIKYNDREIYSNRENKSFNYFTIDDFYKDLSNSNKTEGNVLSKLSDLPLSEQSDKVLFYFYSGKYDVEINEEVMIKLRNLGIRFNLLNYSKEKGNTLLKELNSFLTIDTINMN